MAFELSQQQKQVVNDRGGALLVSAAAGSGKTKVLVERMLQYVTDPISPVNIDDFLIITYTKAAAAELRSKIAKALTERIAEDPGNIRLQHQFQRLYLAKISTVHSFCADILREYAHMLDIPADFRMIESKEDEPLRMQVLDKLLGECYDDLGNDPDFVAFVDTQGVGRDDSQVPELILKVYDSAKCHMDSDGWLEKCVSDAAVDNLTDASETTWGRYLMDELAREAELYVQALTNIHSLCSVSVGMEKLASALEGMIAQLVKLQQAESWDEIHNMGAFDAGNINGVANKKNLDKDLYAQAVCLRDACKTAMIKRLAVFGNDSAQILSDLQSIYPAVRGLVSLVRRFGERYGKLKRGLRVMDFSDLEHKALDLLVGKSRSVPTEAARQIGQRFHQIMVDEYQDSNEVQDAIFTALTDKRNNLFMVGDVKQSIYQFRLADPRIFLKKYNDFSDAGQAQEGEGRKIVLSNNFRSSKAVIDGVNGVFRLCMSTQVGNLDYGDAEALREGVPHEGLTEPAVELHVLDAGSDVYAQEAEYVAERITQLLDGTHMVRASDGFRPIRPDDIAILLRSPKTNGWDYHYALEKRGLHTISSVNVDLLQTEEVQWLRSLLHTINNPRQDIPLLATLSGPVFGFSADDLASIRIHDRKATLYDAMVTMEDSKTVNFVQTLDRLRRIARLHTLPELIEQIFILTGADAVYSAMPDGEIRASNLQDFYQFVVDFCGTPGTDMVKLLQYLNQSEEDGLRVERSGASAGCIRILSIHKSKGLEYPVVFLCGLSKSFNLSDTSEKLLCDDRLGLGLACIDPNTRFRYPSVAHSAIASKMIADTVSEELRVLYVAMTRPQDRLIMTYTVKNVAKELTELAIRMDHCPRLLMTSQARCMGDWVLYTAMHRTDAGQLFVNSRKPENTSVHPDTWHIVYHTCKEADTDTPLEDELDERQADPVCLEQLMESLTFSYDHIRATVVPSKQTATQKKGRLKDQEVAENTPAPKQPNRHWRKPNFAGKQTDGRAYGNAYHAFLQYVCFEACCDEAGAASEVERLISRGFLTAEQGTLIDHKKIASFFATELGQKLRSGGQVLREFKFSILDDASNYAADVEGEKVLLQGVVDCALIEADGITIIDFKTDRVTADTVHDAVERYSAQVQTYADALSRIFELPVKAKALYFFAIEEFAWIS